MEADRPGEVKALDIARVEAEASQLGLALGPFDIENLTHNPLNAVTDDLHAITWAGGAAVRKVVTPVGDGAHHWAASADPEHFNYWRREIDVYTTDLPGRLGLGAPSFLGAVDQPGGAVALWLERVEGASGADLTVDDLAATADALGRSQGRTLQDRPSWLSRKFLRGYSSSKPCDFGRFHDDALWNHPLIASCWPASVRPDFLAMVEGRETLYALAESAPRVVAHLDVWPNNIVRRPGGEPVLLDWAFAGDGAVGEDIGNLIPDAVLDLLIPGDQLGELERAVFGAYVDGLTASGWVGDVRVVRQAMYAAAVKYFWLVPILLGRVDDTEHFAYGQPVSAEQIYTERGVALARLGEWARAALSGEPLA